MGRSFAKVTVTPKGEAALRGGHPWVYDTEVLALMGEPEDGDLTDVYSQKEKYLGTGFFNRHSKLRVRVISRNANDTFDREFFRRRLRHALDYRRTVMGEDFSSCRLIFGEADYFPGLTVDKFGDVLVAEVLSLGIDRIKDMLFPMLIDMLTEYGAPPRVLYERNDSPIREKEGLSCYSGFWLGDARLCADETPVHITENGLTFRVDFVAGQKTGFFLDQKYNRKAAAKLAAGRRVLDCFTHTGAFGLNCAAAGAEHVTSVDVSAEALASAAENARLNGLGDKIDFVKADVFDLLSGLLAEKKRSYDYIILDPPAFTKSAATLKNAIRGYREINAAAMRLLPRGGYLATCSCSHFMTDTYFCQMLHNAAEDTGVSLKQIEERRQSPDHPILWNVPETEYLKFYLFQVV